VLLERRQELRHLAAAFAEALKNRVGTLVVLASPVFYAQRVRLVELAERHRIPAVYPDKAFVVGSAGLMSYWADFQDLFRRAAGYVDRTLKGEKPGDLPAQQPTKFELVLSLKTAMALRLTTQPSLVLRGDQVSQ
jgi:putative ABC transport system substrate-binding protein